MDAQPPVYASTLKVRAYHFLWVKNPVQLTYHRQDYRQALPVLLVRRSRLLGGEFRIPLDRCIHPVRLLPTSRKMAPKLEFAIAFGWCRSQCVHFRAPDAETYLRWTSLIRAALASGRRPQSTFVHEFSVECASSDASFSLASTWTISTATNVTQPSVTANRGVQTMDGRQLPTNGSSRNWGALPESPPLSVGTSSRRRTFSSTTAQEPSSALGSDESALPRQSRHFDSNCSESRSIINELLGRSTRVSKHWFPLL